VPMLALGAGAGAEAGSAQPSARMRSVRSSRSISWADVENERPVRCRTGDECSDLLFLTVCRHVAVTETSHCT